MALDFETRLDTALNSIAQGTSASRVSPDMPEAVDLLLIADHIKSLSPAPEPDLGPGRARFLAHAAALQRVRPRSAWGRAPLRMAFALAVVAALVVILGNVIPAQLESAPTHIPTFTVTPTRFSLVPPISGSSELVLSTDSPMCIPFPAPAPVPNHDPQPADNPITGSKSLLRLQQCRS